MAEETKSTSFLTMAVGVAAVVIILAAVYGASQIISQFLMAFVITVAVAPVQAWLIRRGLRPVLAFLLTVVGLVVTIGLVILVLTASLNSFIQSLPQYKDQFAELQKQISRGALVARHQPDDDRVQPVHEHERHREAIAGAAQWLLSGFASFGFMLALAVFMLAEATHMPAKVKAISLPARRAPMDRFVNNVRSYVVVTAWVNLLVGVVDTMLLLAMGIPYAVLWGALAFLFGFIPSIGFLLSLVGPALMALLVSGPQAAAIVIVAFIVINGGIQNIILPRQMGEGTDLSPAVVFGSLMFWGFILGPVGRDPLRADDDDRPAGPRVLREHARLELPHEQREASVPGGRVAGRRRGSLARQGRTHAEAKIEAEGGGARESRRSGLTSARVPRGDHRTDPGRGRRAVRVAQSPRRHCSRDRREGRRYSRARAPVCGDEERPTERSHPPHLDRPTIDRSRVRDARSWRSVPSHRTS